LFVPSLLQHQNKPFTDHINGEDFFAPGKIFAKVQTIDFVIEERERRAISYVKHNMIMVFLEKRCRCLIVYRIYAYVVLSGQRSIFTTNNNIQMRKNISEKNEK